MDLSTFFIFIPFSILAFYIITYKRDERKHKVSKCKTSQRKKMFTLPTVDWSHFIFGVLISCAFAWFNIFAGIFLFLFFVIITTDFHLFPCYISGEKIKAFVDAHGGRKIGNTGDYGEYSVDNYRFFYVVTILDDICATVKRIKSHEVLYDSFESWSKEANSTDKREIIRILNDEM